MLTIVPTPIGNLGDIAPRAVEALRACDVVAAEDTRHTGMLLHHLGIGAPLLSFHEHNEASRTAELVARLRDGQQVALVSDAGTPGLCDPGLRLVRACRSEGLPVTVLPGPCAAVTALAGSGFDASAFHFGGFLPVKSGQRARALEAALARESTSVFYESPHRVAKTLAAVAGLDAAREVCVARELTKKFEEYLVGTPGDLLAHFDKHPPRGEICLVVSGKNHRPLRPPATPV